MGVCIFLTASGDELSVVRGLDMGADDYIAKPFRPRELLSRIRRVLRQYEGTSKNIALGCGVVVDTEKGVVTKHGEALELTALVIEMGDLPQGLYLLNILTEDGSDTYCPECGTEVVKRTGYLVDVCGLNGNRCLSCKTKLNFIN